MGRGRVWNPEEHYIWIEPNVKYLISFPGAERYAPLPWYDRPPPRPARPGPPPDKLRYVSTRRIRHAFDRGSIAFKQTVADDLDSLVQTFLNALLKRTGFMPNLLHSYGEQELWALKETRNEAYDYFWRVARQQEDSERARELRRAQSAAEEVNPGPEVGSASSDRETEAEAEKVGKGPEGVDAMVGALYEMMKLSGVQLNLEDRVMRELWGRETKEQQGKRAAEYYEKFTDAMRKVLEAAELGEKRTAMRKAAKKEKKERRKAEKQEKGETSTQTDEEKSAEEDKMDVDEDPLEDLGLQDEAEASGDESSSSTETPPKKRARIE